MPYFTGKIENLVKKYLKNNKTAPNKLQLLKIQQFSSEDLDKVNLAFWTFYPNLFFVITMSLTMITGF